MTPGPLTGVRVVELAGIGPGPFAGMMLAELGADVIKVDRPGGGGFGVPWQHDLPNRGRPSACVDLKKARGIEVIHRLVEHADVFIEGLRPGVAERLGIGPDDLVARHPALVYGRVTGWGQDGPKARQAGHDITYLASTGLLNAIGPRDRPAIPLNLLGDYAGGSLYLVIGVLAALYEAKESGRGQVVDAAIVDGVSHLATVFHGMATGGVWSERRSDNLLDGGTPFYDVYETQDGRFMAVGPLEARFYEEFVRLIDPPGELPERTDIDQWPALRSRIAARFAERTQREWIDIFAGSEACVEAVATLGEAARHPHLSARQTLIRHDGVPQPTPAPRFSRTPTSLSTGPRRPGQDSREALLAWGITDVEQLIASGAVIQADEEGP